MKYAFSFKTRYMKKIILLLLAFIFVSSLKAQNTYVETPGRWRLGFNMGAIWLGSDVKTAPGLGGGFNLEKILNKRGMAPIGFSLGFRYLGGRTYGLNTSPTYDLKDNKAMNGTYDSTLRYDSVPGYFYANHKTFIQEGALEFKVNFPAFEQRTHIILHFWGGVGIGKYKTWINARDEQGKLYDLSSTKGVPVNESDLSRIYKGSYETLAEGSGSNGTIRFMPSCGVGLGFRFSKNVALVFEHKVSFPGTDYVDGFTYGGACVNDFIHYSGANLIFTMHGKSGSSHSGTNTNTNTNVYTNTNTTNTVTTTNTQVTSNTVVPTNTVVVQTPRPNPPRVNITYPYTNFKSQYDNVGVSAQLQYVTSSQQIGITLNGYPLSHFSFNPSNGVLNFQSFLALGNNTFVVTATNDGGTASDQVTVIYNPQLNTGGNITPTVTTTNTVSTIPTGTVTINQVPTPTTNTTATVTPTNTVSSNPTGTVTVNTIPTNTVSSNPTGTVTVNTIPTNTVSSNPTGTVTVNTIPTNTVSSNPTGTVTVNTIPTNTVSSNPTGTVTVNTPTSTPTPTVTTTQNPQGQPPVVNIINPATNPLDLQVDNFNVSGSILNISNNNEVQITLNGSPVTLFTYSNRNKMFNFTAKLQEGANTVVVKATNHFGSDTKSTVIKYKPGKPPKVVISVPAASPFNTFNANNTVSGTVYYVNGQSDITVTANGAGVPFSFSKVNGSVNVNLVLQVETTQVTITAKNQFGSDAQSVNLVYVTRTSNSSTVTADNPIGVTTPTVPTTGTTMGGIHKKPAITVIDPASDPLQTSNASVNVKANVNYIYDASKVTVSSNGVNVPSNFNLNANELTFTASLQSGMNTYVISGSNQYGTSTKSVNINYTPPANTQMTICHIPPGNPNNPQQITIPASAWPAHQAHGDTQGPCQTGNNGGNNGNGNNGGNNGNGNNGGNNGNGNNGGNNGNGNNGQNQGNQGHGSQNQGGGGTIKGLLNNIKGGGNTTTPPKTNNGGGGIKTGDGPPKTGDGAPKTKPEDNKGGGGRPSGQQQPGNTQPTKVEPTNTQPPPRSINTPSVTPNNNDGGGGRTIGGGGGQ